MCCDQDVTIYFSVISCSVCKSYMQYIELQHGHKAACYYFYGDLTDRILWKHRVLSEDGDKGLFNSFKWNSSSTRAKNTESKLRKMLRVPGNIIDEKKSFFYHLSNIFHMVNLLGFYWVLRPWIAIQTSLISLKFLSMSYFSYNEYCIRFNTSNKHSVKSLRWCIFLKSIKRKLT